MRDVGVENQYALTLDQLRMLAQRDLLDWWVGTGDMPFFERRQFLAQYFADIVALYGGQASEAAADYLFLQRSLDDDLAGLVFPDVADPVGYEQAVASFNAGMRADEVTYAAMLNGDARAFARAEQQSLKKLQGITNRLVLQPARETVGMASEEAGTLFARLPEPGACPWCMMIASRGNVYRNQRAAAGKDYHDNCRCMAIEVKTWSELPKINKDLQARWEWLEDENGGGLSFKEWEASFKDSEDTE